MPTKVPWKDLFNLNSWEMTRDSVARKTHRHYRVVLDLAHRELNDVKQKLEPYGFVVTAVHSWRGKQKIKAIRQTKLA